MPAVGRDADAVDPPPQVTATPQPRSVPARNTANVSLPTTVRRPASLRDDLRERLLLGWEVDPGDKAPRPRRPSPLTPSPSARLEQAGEDGEAALDSEVMR